MGRSDTTTLNVPFATPQAAVTEIKPDLPAAAPAEVKRPLTHCPYCSCKISSVEAKMERCLSCGAQLNSSVSVLSRAADSESFIVRI
jgi:hypothetical protein